MPLRKATNSELRFIEFMIREGNLKVNADWSQKLMVAPMDEAGMGSLVLYPDGEIVTGRSYGRTLFEVEFKDADHVSVLASLNLDQHGKLFELDLWKINFNPLISLPEV